MAGGLSRLIKDYLPGGASRLAALLLPQILPVFSVVAPCHPGAALRNLGLVQPRQATRNRLVRGSSLVGAVLLVILAAPSGSSQDRKVVRMTAERFTFSPSQIKVKQGTVIELRLRSDDTNHGFRIIGSETNLIIPKRGRGEASLIFRADTPGRYTFECSKMCGAGHSFMRGEIIVEDQEQP